MTEWYKKAAKAVDQQAVERALVRQDELTKPPGSLGRLEHLATRLAGLQGTDQPCADQVFIAIFAGDHGVVAEGVSAFPQAVTVEMIRNFAGGGAAISVLARTLQSRFQVINMGTVHPTEAMPGVREVQIAAGTHNFLECQAMSYKQMQKALEAGKRVIDDAATEPLDLFIGGEMGIGNSTSAAALTASLLRCDAAEVAGPGTGLDGAGVSHKAQVINQALAKHQAEIRDGLSLLNHLGGFEIAGLVAAYIRAAQLGIPSLVDGFITTAAAAVALQINPSIKPWLFFSHQSAEPAHQKLLGFLNEEPLIKLDMRLGEGSGAAVAVPLLRSACALHNEMASFTDAGVSKGDDS